MAETESNSSIFLKWAGGIVASVITAVGIYYFTKPTPPPPPPPVVLAQTGFDGFVQDAVSHNLLRGATMTLTLGPNSIAQSTDASGKYSVVLPSPGTNASMGMVAITAAGYQPYSNSVELKPGDNYAVIPIDAASNPIVAAPESAIPLPSGVVASVGAPESAPPPPPQNEGHSRLLVTGLPSNFVRAQTKFLEARP